MPALRNALQSLTAADVQAVVDEKWVENELLELKRTLSHRSNGVQDQWLIDQGDIGNGAKRDLLAEVVAMANSYGGDVILGIDQTKAKPPRAREVEPLPKCVELAHRLELAARDLIKPQIPMLGVRGIPIAGEDGVVVFRVPRSRLAPHRLEMKGIEKECYRRVGERTEPMTMREIQDLTFSVARGLDAVEARLTTMRSEFGQWYHGIPTADRWCGYSLAAIPLSADLYIDNVFRVKAAHPTTQAHAVVFGPKAGHRYSFEGISQPYNWRPILRGIEAATEASRDHARLQRLGCDGVLLDMTRMHSTLEKPIGSRDDYMLHPGWLFAGALDAIENVDRFRVAAGAHGVQFALEVVIGATHSLPVFSIGTGRYSPVGALPARIVLLPRYQIGERDSWPDTLRLIYRDFWSCVGLDATDDDPHVEGWE